jgi:tellurite resistance protein TerC
MTALLWGGFIAVIGAMLAFDLAVVHRRNRPIGVYESLAWTVFWVMLALSFAIGVYNLYDNHVFGAGLAPDHALDGRAAALQFFTGYLIEKSLSIENIFAIALIFSHFRLPLEFQYRVLFWGVFGAVVLRGVMIAGGVTLIGHFAWMSYVFGVLLVATAVRLLLHRDEVRPDRSLLVRLCRRFLPLSERPDGDRFLTRGGGRRAATPLLLALLMVMGADLVYALNSIPAIIAVTRDPFLIFSANIFAILGLRSLYFVLAGLLARLRYLKLSLVFLLGFVGVKMLLADYYPVSTAGALLVICAILAAGVLLSLFVRPRAVAPVSPLAEDLGELLVLSVKGARRIVVLVIGSTVVLIGVVMIVLPGPAVLVIPAGLAILATEFIWARRLLNRLKHEAKNITDNARGLFGHRKRDAADAAPEKDRGG